MTVTNGHSASWNWKVFTSAEAANISETRPLIGDNEWNAVLVHKIGILCAEHSSGFGYVQENTKIVAGAAFGLVST